MLIGGNGILLASLGQGKTWKNPGGLNPGDLWLDLRHFAARGWKVFAGRGWRDDLPQRGKEPFDHVEASEVLRNESNSER